MTIKISRYELKKISFDINKYELSMKQDAEAEFVAEVIAELNDTQLSNELYRKAS